MNAAIFQRIANLLRGGLDGAEGPWTLRTWALLALALAAVAWVRLQAVSLGGLDQVATSVARQRGIPVEEARREAEEQLTFRVEDGRRFRYIQDTDSYFWLRAARNLVERGTVCDEGPPGSCRDAFGSAPLGREHTYALSFHVKALAFVHRVATWLDPARPLVASAPWLAIVLGVLGVIPAFALGRRLAGDFAGLVAGCLAMVHRSFLARSATADNDIWNVVLPLFAAWLAIEAASAAGLGGALAWASAAAFLVGLHAWIWDGWFFGLAVILGGLGGHAALLASTILFARLRGDRDPDGRAARLRPMAARSALLTAFLAVAALSCVALLKSPEEALETPRQILDSLSWSTSAPTTGTEGDDSGGVFNPDPLNAVRELARPNLFDMTTFGGPVVFFFGWLGLLCLLAPAGRLSTVHFALLLGANLLFRQVWGNEAMSPLVFAMTLSTPLLAAMVALSWLDRDRDDEYPAATVLVLVWFLAALVLSRRLVRFEMMVAVPFALAAGALFGRSASWLRTVAGPLLVEKLQRRPASGAKGERAALAIQRLRDRVALGMGAAQVAVLAAALAFLAPPVEAGRTLLLAVAGMLTTSWTQAFAALEEQTTADTVVDAQWDVAYWIQFFAGRGTSADGGGLRTGAPYWIARALVAPGDAETIGILRMLHCGGAALEGPDLPRSAVHRLASAGLHPSMVPGFLARLVALPREEARAALEAESVAPDRIEAVLEATHCEAPPSALLLSSFGLNVDFWRYLGNWDHRRAWIAFTGTKLPRTEAVEFAVRELRYGRREAEALLDEAAAIPETGRTRHFISSLEGFARADWSACVPEAAPGASAPERSAGAAWSCAVGGRLDGRAVEAVRWSTDPLGRIDRVVVKRAASGQAPTDEVQPALVLVADGRTLAPEGGLSKPSPSPRDLAVLVDLPGARVLVGTASVLSSTQARLYFLPPVYSPGWERLDSRPGFLGEQVSIWRPRLETTARPR